MIPQCLLVVGILTYLGDLGLHQLDDGHSATQAFLAVGQRSGVVNHFLYLAPIFRQLQLFALCVVIESLYFHFVVVIQSYNNGFATFAT